MAHQKIRNSTVKKIFHISTFLAYLNSNKKRANGEVEFFNLYHLMNYAFGGGRKFNKKRCT